MDAFLDEVQAQAVAVSVVRCSVTKWLETQADLTDKGLREAAEAVNVASVHRAMQTRGYLQGRSAVERHMNGNCACPIS